MDGYYSGVGGARRLMNELDQFLQNMLDSMELAESLTCAIELTVTEAESGSGRTAMV
jgi:hypothetical protein